MILIADSGATKTDWMVISEDLQKEIHTQGINPFHQTKERIENTIYNELIPQLECYNIKEFEAVYFYGAGCLPESSKVIKDTISSVIPDTIIEIQTDLMGAARALCQNQPGIACILGTGSNSCEYNGKDIINNVSPLGYILGDEGSGAYLGKRFLGDCLKGQLPSYLKDGLMKELNLTTKDILNKVYREPQANRFLASITPYIYRHKNEDAVKDLLKDCFEEFFKRNLSTYNKQLNVSFTGSISWFFQEEIKTTATELGYSCGKFIKNPIYGLAEYHKC